jgi:hypothetical protein
MDKYHLITASIWFVQRKINSFPAYGLDVHSAALLSTLKSKLDDKTAVARIEYLKCSVCTFISSVASFDSRIFSLSLRRRLNFHLARLRHGFITRPEGSECLEVTVFLQQV